MPLLDERCGEKASRLVIASPSSLFASLLSKERLGVIGDAKCSRPSVIFTQAEGEDALPLAWKSEEEKLPAQKLSSRRPRAKGHVKKARDKPRFASREQALLAYSIHSIARRQSAPCDSASIKR